MSSSRRSEEGLVRGFLRRAIQTDAPLLAPILHRYAEAEGVSWEGLAQSLGCTADALDQVALCRPPRAEHFTADVDAIAADLVEPDRLFSLLRQLQVLGVLAEAPAPAAGARQGAGVAPSLFLAARDWEEPEELEEPETGGAPEGDPRNDGGDALAEDGPDRDEQSDPGENSDTGREGTGDA